MTEHTDTERNEAIAYFEKKKSETEYRVDLGFGDYQDKESINFFTTAITALRNQSEAERRIERVRERCELVMEVKKPFNSDYIEANHILEILEES